MHSCYKLCMFCWINFPFVGDGMNIKPSDDICYGFTVLDPRRRVIYCKERWYVFVSILKPAYRHDGNRAVLMRFWNRAVSFVSVRRLIVSVFYCLCGQTATLPECHAEVPGWSPKQGETFVWLSYQSFIHKSRVCCVWLWMCVCINLFKNRIPMVLLSVEKCVFWIWNAFKMDTLKIFSRKECPLKIMLCETLFILYCYLWAVVVILWSRSFWPLAPKGTVLRAIKTILKKVTISRQKMSGH